MENETVILMNEKMRAKSRKLVAQFNGSPISRSFGTVLSYTDEGQAVFDQPYNPDFNHGIGDVHGGVIATMIDNAGWFTTALRYDTWINTVDLIIHMLEPANREALKATGTLVRAGAHLAVTNMEVRSESGRLVATGSGTFSVSSIPLSDE